MMAGHIMGILLLTTGTHVLTGEPVNTELR
ncbi:hypothetical protein PMIT1342_01038 [Prochlorococcus marinus str. MIT 1342]|nr:hypothetical protein PMIT1342_01038 [Prochlorococcus marinus str. MIT 1342]